METIEQNISDLLAAVLTATEPTPVLFPSVIFTRFDPVFIRFTWTGNERLSFVGFNSASPLESLTPIGGQPGEWQYLAVIAPGASAADVIAEIEKIAGVGPVKI
jgi:hypothetical protein